jgi:hypothetical protein
MPVQRVMALVRSATGIQLLGFDDTDNIPKQFVLEDDRTWTPAPAVGLPTARAYAGVAHDPDTFDSWVFGGTTDDAQLWHWDGTTWELVDVAGDIPIGVRSSGLGFDPERRTVVAYGGLSTVAQDQVVVLDPATSTWSSAATPGPRRTHAMAFDRDSCRLLAIAGTDDASPFMITYGFDGRNWLDLGTDPFPTHRTDVDAVLDTHRDRIVLIGGTENGGSGYRDAWEWIAGRWMQTAPAGEAPDDSGGRAVYDAVGRRVIYAQHNPNPTPTWWEYTTRGGPCDDDGDCMRGDHCTDGVCCASPACLDEQVCNASASPGTCAPPDIIP